jgi:hypothetical protein
MTWEQITIVTGGICTVAIFSFLIGENRVYRTFEHLFIGIAAGFAPVLTIKNFLWPNVLSPLLGFNIEKFPDGTILTPYDTSYLWYILPLSFGLLYYTIYSKRFGWLAKLVIGLSLGFSAGLGIKGFFAEMVPQITSSLKPLIVIANGSINWWASTSNTIFIGAMMTVLFYFLSTVRYPATTRVFNRGSEEGHKGSFSMLARWVMMICFGAFFGSTVMARMALLVERVQFMSGSWFPTIKSIALGG